MLLMNLTTKPSPLEANFFAQTLTQEDKLLISGSAISLAFQANTLPATGLIRHSDAAKVGGTVDDSWQIISDQQWIDLVITTDKTVTW